MRPTHWLSCAPLLALLAPLSYAKKPAVNVTFPESAPANANVVDDNFLGVSWELSAVPSLWGNTTDQIPDAILNYLANIRARMSSPLRMRVGGNSMDSSFYDPNQPDMLVLTDPNAYFNDVPTSIGPVLFDVMSSISDSVGGMDFIIGLSMQHPDNSSDLIQLASAAETKLGSRLDAMALGNEPDLYAGHGTRTSYSISDYIPELQEVMNALETSQFGNLLSKPILAGPTICCSWNLSDVLNGGMSQLTYKYYTLQHYPTYVCAGQTDASGNITYYLSHVNVSPFLSGQADGMAIARQQNVPVLLTEYNTASCGGDPRVAPTFAASLWAVDVALKSAELNYAGVYLHTREVGITYNLFQPATSDPTQPDWQTGSPYYATLVVAESLSNITSVVVDLNIGNSENDPHATVAAYGIYDGPTRYRSKLVLLNFNYPKNETVTPYTTSQTFVLPPSLADNLSIRYLQAPNITEQTNISWAGQTVQSNGELQPNGQDTQSMSCHNGCEIEVPGPGLAVVWLDPELQAGSIYVGDSTIAPTKSSANSSSSSNSSKSAAVMTQAGPFSPFNLPICLLTMLAGLLFI